VFIIFNSFKLGIRINLYFCDSRNPDIMTWILLYATELSPRLRYTARLIFDNLLGVVYELTDNRSVFNAYPGPKINYSHESLPAGIHIVPSGLLNQRGITDVAPELSQAGSIPVLFQTIPGGLIPFDLFAASFFLISRYEEYLPFSPDRHGRYKAEDSLAVRKGFVNRPLVNEWAGFLKEKLLLQWPAMIFKPREFNFQPTIDVDNAWAFLNKGLLRITASSLRDLFTGHPERLIRRFNVLSGRALDPYDNFAWIHSRHSEASCKAVWFFLLGRYGRYDTNIPSSHPAMKGLVQECNKVAELGIHPSYGSGLKKERIGKEINTLSGILSREILKSRQHYLRIRLPDTYRNLIDLGIRHDYSMGYASIPGFRASVCTPFPFYDLLREEVTDLIIHPFQYMDRTSIDYMKTKPESVLPEIIALAKQVQNWGGEFVTIFHNETFTPDSEGLEWRRIYGELLSALRQNSLK
jgi:hypothetical protein